MDGRGDQQDHGGVDRGAPPAGLDRHLPTPVPRRRHAAGTAIVLGGLAAAALWAAFTGIGPARFDGRVLAAAVEGRTGGRTTATVLVTEIGNTLAMGLLALAVGALLWWRGRARDAVFLVGAMAGGVALFRGLKIAFDRTRPPALSQVVAEGNESLPSGHAVMSITVIGALVVLGWERRALLGRVVTVAAGLTWVGLVGTTRLYLGVHWFSDVLAGWLVGAAWLALCTTAWLAWRRHVAHRTSATDRV